MTGGLHLHRHSGRAQRDPESVCAALDAGLRHRAVVYFEFIPFALSVASAASEVETQAALRLRPLRAYAQGERISNWTTTHQR